MADESPEAVLRRDPALVDLIDQHGPLQLEPVDDTFERLVTSIISQQVSTSAATAIRQRLFDTFEVSPTSIAAADHAELTDVGLSTQKATYIQGVAEVYLEEGYDRAYFEGMDDAAVIDELTDIHGIGTWTAQMFLMFCLGREDVFPVADLGIRNAMHAVIDPDLSRTEMVERAEDWRPYRSYAALYLWKAVD